MNETLRAFIQDLDSVRKAVNATKAQQLGSVSTREQIQRIVDSYFALVRSAVIPPKARTPTTERLDTLMQELLSLSHRRGTVRRYKQLLSSARKSLVALDAESLLLKTDTNSSGGHDAVDVMIIQTLARIVPSAALSYEQALSDLDTDSRLSWRGPASDLREALRECLDVLAPDKDVEQSAGYKQNPKVSGPTMRQKVRFILKSRGKSKKHSETSETAAAAIDELIGTFVRSVYTRSSVSTHTPTDKNEVLRLYDLVRTVLCELLEIHRQPSAPQASLRAGPA